MIDAAIRRQLRSMALQASIVFALCLILWPSVIHEPLHLIALWLQGSSGHIIMDFGIGAMPHTVRTAPVAGVAGGLFFLLLPSIVNAIGIAAIAAKKNIRGWMIGLAVWLAFDLALNAMQFRSPGNDFHFLVAVPGGRMIALIIAITAGIGAAVNILKVERSIMKIRYQIKCATCKQWFVPQHNWNTQCAPCKQKADEGVPARRLKAARG